MESSEENSDKNHSPEEALAAIKQAREDTSKLSQAPAGYYILLGLAMAMLAFSQVLDRTWSATFMVSAFALIIASITWYSKKVPTWGFNKIFTKTAWPFWTMVLIALVGQALTASTGTIPVAIITAVMTFVSWSILGPIWDRAYRKQMTEVQQ